MNAHSTTQTPMYDPNDEAPMVPITNIPTTHTTRTDGGERSSESESRQRFDRPPETTGTEEDRHREVIEPGAADLR